MAKETHVNAQVRLVMLILEERALDWHHFYAQKKGGFYMLELESYAQILKDKFGSQTFQDLMMDLMTLKNIGSVDQYHGYFISLLNQLHLPEPYVLNIFISN